MQPHRLAAVLVACAALFPLARSAAFAQDDVDLEVVGNGAVKGTIRPAGERERFQVVLGRGAKVKALAKAKAKKGPFVPAVEFVGPESDEPLLTGTTKGRTTSLRTPAPVTAGGPHAVRVLTGTGIDGDYVLNFTVTSQKVFQETGVATPGQTGIEVVFGAPAGAKARIVLAPKKSGFVPALDELVSPSGGSTALSGSKAGPIVLTDAGDWKVRFHDGGAAGGEWSFKVVLALPRKKTSRIDISAAALTGPFADQQAVYGRYVAPDDGDTLLDPPDTGSPIDGTTVMIPAGGMPYPVVVTLSEAEQFDTGDGTSAAGPAVQFGPEGIQFNADATITIPYDPAQFTDPATELEVYVVHGDEGPAKVEPRSLLDFSVPGYVSFPVTGFSTFMSASSRPRPILGRWIVGSVSGSAEFDFGGTATAVAGRADFVPTRQAPEFYVSLSGLRTTWQRSDKLLAEPVSFTDFAFESDQGVYDEGFPSGQFIRLFSQTETETDLVRAPDGDAMVVLPTFGFQDEELSFLLRAADGFPTLANVAGEWNLVAFISWAETMGSGPRQVRLNTETVLGTTTFTSDGRAPFVVTDSVRAESDYVNPPWRVEKQSFRGTGKLEINDGRLLMYLPDEESETGLAAPFQLYAALSGEVLIGAREDVGDEPGLFVFVRQGKNLSKKALNGKADFATLARIHAERTSESRPQGLQAAALFGTRLHDGAGRVDVSAAFGEETAHDVEGSAISAAANEPGRTTDYTLSPTGVYRETGGFRGAMAPSGVVLFGVSTPAGRAALTLIVPGLDYFTTPK